MTHPTNYMVITEGGTTAQRRYSLAGDTPSHVAYWTSVVTNLKRVSVYPPDKTHRRAFIRLALFRTRGLDTEMSSMPSRTYAYSLPNGRHLFLAEYDDVLDGMLFDIVNRVPFPGLTFTSADLTFLLGHPAATVRLFALTNLV